MHVRGVRIGFAAVMVVVAASCAAGPGAGASNAEHAAPAWRRTAIERRAWTPRPTIDIERLLPDFHEERRWPLSAMSHPELAPRFPIAQVFAMPGIDWLELCQRGAHKRTTAGTNRDELDYLRGWCAAANGDADAACAELIPLRSSSVLGLGTAIPYDLANILASVNDIDDAERLLSKYRISDTQVLDLLAATYLELGMDRHAYEVNRRALDTPGRTTRADRCRRLTRSIVLGPESERPLRAAELEQQLTDAKSRDATCASLHVAARCWIERGRTCKEYLAISGAPHTSLPLLLAYRAWPQQDASAARWSSVGTLALDAIPADGARELAVAAFDMFMRTAEPCADTTLATLRAAQHELHETRLQARIDACRVSGGITPAPARTIEP